MRSFLQKLYCPLVVFIASLLVISGCSILGLSTKKDKELEVSGKEKKEHKHKPYNKVITNKALTDEGLFDVHKVKDKYYYEIPDSLLNRPMLLVSRIAGIPQNLGFGGAGMKTHSQQVLRWQKNKDKILLRHVSYESVADPNDPIYKSVQDNNFEPIVYSFDIKTIGKDSSTSVIDVTKFFTSDVPIISALSKKQRSEFQVLGLDSRRSFIDSIRAYPKNIEVQHVLTFNSSKPPTDGPTGTISLKMNQSMILLPEEKMRRRAMDKRVGYFSINKVRYGGERNMAEHQRFITRYSLIPKDKQAYMNGKLVEPMEPIVYYLDPATPVKWRKYIKEGVEDWQKAFEAAGFKNAIIAKDPPAIKEDSTFSPEDIRYSVIRYIANEIPNAVGPNVHDPRTGEILEGDVLWFHNVMKLLHNWYFVQTAAANPKARAVEYSDKVTGELIRFVSSHEVGHTLGLPHNWGSSYAYPVDSLRSPTFTATHGTAPSIMDYARFNYVAQPGDGVKNFHPAIGAYDKWAIKWGYSWFPDDMSSQQIKAKLNEWTRRRAGNPLYFYGRQTKNKIDPRSQNEDLGNDAMKASELGIENLKRITSNLNKWTNRDGADFDELKELYQSIINQWARYMGHVTKNVGGIYETFKTYNQEGPVFEFVSQDQQKRAMDFIVDHAFATPGWMLENDILDRINRSSVVENIRKIQLRVLNDLTEPERIARLIEYEARSKKDIYTDFEMMDDLRNGIWSELDDNSRIDVYRRNLQRAYINRMKHVMNSETSKNSDIRSVVRSQLEILLKSIKQSENRINDRASRAHLADIEQKINQILHPDE